MKMLLLSFFGLSILYGQTCTQTFTPQTIGSSPYPGSNVNTAVQKGSTGTVLCFASGTYGEIDLYGATPPGIVTLKPASGALAILGVINLNGVKNVTITGFRGGSQVSGGLAIVNASLGSSSNITFSNNDLGSSGVVIRDNTIANANIQIVNNTITNFRASSGYEPAMIVVNGTSSSCPNGITFQGNHVNGISGDGMGTGGGACGTRFIGNEIEGFVQSGCGSVHCDGFQDNGGGRQTLLDGNYFHNNSVCFGLYDGSSGLIIRNNVCDTAPGAGYWMQFGGANTITFDHNTIRSAAGAQYGNDHGGTPSANVTFINNIFPSQPVQNNGQPVSGVFLSDYNLCPSGCTGSHSVSGAVTYVGGANPTNYVGFGLAITSKGVKIGNDGQDMGIVVSSQTTTPVYEPPTQISAIVVITP